MTNPVAQTTPLLRGLRRPRVGPVWWSVHNPWLPHSALREGVVTVVTHTHDEWLPPRCGGCVCLIVLVDSVRACLTCTPTALWPAYRQQRTFQTSLPLPLHGCKNATFYNVSVAVQRQPAFQTAHRPSTPRPPLLTAPHTNGPPRHRPPASPRSWNAQMWKLLGIEPWCFRWGTNNLPPVDTVPARRAV